MLERENGVLRAVAWTEICPWLKIVRVFRLAISFRVLLLGAAGAVLMMAAWSILAGAFHVQDESTRAWMAPGTGCPMRSCAQSPFFTPASEQLDRMPMVGVWMQLSRPVWAAFAPGGPRVSVLCLFLCGLSSLAIWAFFGTAIARIASVQLAADERVGLVAALRFACSKWLSCFSAPLWPIGGVCLLAIPLAILGLLMRVGIGLFLVGLLWPLFLALGIVMAVLLLGVLVGWPLMFSTVSTEGTDCFDALSRSYAYSFQRPLHYLFYAAVATALGVLGWIVVWFVTEKVIDLAYWGASWGCSAERANWIREGSDELKGIGGAGASVIRFWCGCLRVLALGFIYGYFWSAVSAIYLLLRRDVDATETDEVYLDADGTETAPPLAPIAADEKGAPVIENPSAGAD